MRFAYPSGLRYRSYNHSDIPVLRRKDIFLCSVRNGYILQDQCKVYRQLISERGQGSFFQSDISYIPGISLHPMLRIWPHRARGDGQFAALLRRAGGAGDAGEGPEAQAGAGMVVREVSARGDGADGSGGLSSAHPAASIDMWLDALPKARPARRAGKAAPAPDVSALLRELGKCAVSALPVPPQSARLHLEGRRLIAAPLDAPELDGLRVVSPGLALLRAETGRVEPEHALAMALLPGMARREAALTEKEALAFIAGEALPREGEAGWTLVTHAGLPLGWGKQAGGMLKNHVPKGLRARLHP